MENALLLLWISLGLTVAFFIAIVCTWLYSYMSLLMVKNTNIAFEGIFAILLTPDGEKQRFGIKKLQRYVKKSRARKELLIKFIIQQGDTFMVNNHARIMYVVEKTEIDSFLMKLLASKSAYKQSLACLYIGELKVYSMQESMYTCMTSQNNDVIYNFLLALAKLGDLKGLSNSLRTQSSNINLSFRAIIEVITVFSGSKEDLIKETIELSDDYMKGVLIKAAADNECRGLTEHYVSCLYSDNKNLRIACIRAISELKDPVNEHYVSAMLEDKEWEVRAAAAKGLEKIGTMRSFEVLRKVVHDKEWWVRQNAASALISIPGGREYANQIINGDDQYASDAIVGVLEMAT